MAGFATKLSCLVVVFRVLIIPALHGGKNRGVSNREVLSVRASGVVKNALATAQEVGCEGGEGIIPHEVPGLVDAADLVVIIQDGGLEVGVCVVVHRTVRSGGCSQCLSG